MSLSLSLSLFLTMIKSCLIRTASVAITTTTGVAASTESVYDLRSSSSSAAVVVHVVVVSGVVVIVASPASVCAAPAAHLHRRHGHVVGVFALVASSTPTHLEVSAGFRGATAVVSHPALLLLLSSSSSVSSSSSLWWLCRGDFCQQPRVSSPTT